MTFDPKKFSFTFTTSFTSSSLTLEVVYSRRNWPIHSMLVSLWMRLHDSHCRFMPQLRILINVVLRYAKSTSVVLVITAQSSLYGVKTSERFFLWAGKLLKVKQMYFCLRQFRLPEKAILCCDPVLTKMGISLDSNSEIFFTIWLASPDSVGSEVVTITTMIYYRKN